MITFCTAKMPLIYQRSNYDCVPVSFQNSISCLYHRKSIPAEVLKSLYCYTLDNFDRNGSINGSSIHSIELITHWINSYKTAKFDIEAEFRYGQKASIRAIDECIDEGGVAILELQMWRWWHYVLVMQSDNKRYYCFDPYHKRIFRAVNAHVERLRSDGYKPNLCIDKIWLKSYRRNKQYCLGSKNERVIILLKRRN